MGEARSGDIGYQHRELVWPVPVPGPLLAELPIQLLQEVVTGGQLVLS